MEQNKTNQVLLQSLNNKISFNNIDVNLKLNKIKKLRAWLNVVIHNENKNLEVISYNFCSDKRLNKINNKYLNHDDYTDIITFDLSDGGDIFADIYISTERIKENSLKHKTSYKTELMRVMVHGVLHLCGYKDKSQNEEKIMRGKEDFYLSLWEEFPVST